jgi:hypothetical protein
MLSLAIWLAILWACFAFGAAALKWLGAHVPRPEGLPGGPPKGRDGGPKGLATEGPAEEVPFAIAIGMGALSYLVLAAGLLGQLRVPVGVCLVCVLAGVGWRYLGRLPRYLVQALGSLRSYRWTAAPLAAFLLASFVLTLIGALAPAADSDYDGLVYHLTIPKVYLRDGHIHFLPWLSHSNFPFTLEMLYLLGLLLKGQALSKLFHFGCGWLTALAIFAFAKRAWGARAGWLAASVFAAVPLVAWEMTCAYNELAFALYAFLAIYALSRWYEDRQAATGWLWVAAIMCGLALGVKMLAMAVVMFAVLVSLRGLWREQGWRRQLGRLIVFLVIATAVASPWYMKSYLWTGNPVYPFFYGLFDGKYWNAHRAADYAQAQHTFGLGENPLSFAALPWNLTMRPAAFFDQPQAVNALNTLIWVFGPLFLALLPTLLAGGRVGTYGQLALWFALAYTALWFLMSQNGRYLIPVLPGLSACVGMAAARLLERRGLLSGAVMVALLLSLAAALYAGVTMAAPAARVALGLQAPTDYLNQASRVYPILDAVNCATPQTARIMVFGDEPRMFYLDRDFLFATHADIFSASDLATPSTFLAALRRMRVTHLLLHFRVIHDMDAGRGRMETDLAALRNMGVIKLRQDFGLLSLWEIADGTSESAVQ